MIPGETCATCKAYSALTSECRRKSPTAVVIPQGPGQIGIKGVYPATPRDGWCCEWQAAEVNSELRKSKELVTS